MITHDIIIILFYIYFNPAVTWENKIILEKFQRFISRVTAASGCLRNKMLK